MIFKPNEVQHLIIYPLIDFIELYALFCSIIRNINVLCTGGNVGPFVFMYIEIKFIFIQIYIYQTIRFININIILFFNSIQ